MWIYGRPTVIQKTTKPDDVFPENWKDLNDKAKEKEIARWEVEGALRRKLRENRNCFRIEEEEMEEYSNVMKRAKEKFSNAIAPSMAVVDVLGQKSQV